MACFPHAFPRSRPSSSSASAVMTEDLNRELLNQQFAAIASGTGTGWEEAGRTVANKAVDMCGDLKITTYHGEIMGRS